MPSYSVKNKKRLVFSALFDVRPTTQVGDLDVVKIRQSKRILDLRGLKNAQEEELRRKAIRIDLIEEPIDPNKGLSAGDQIILDRLEADMGTDETVQRVFQLSKIEESINSQTQPAPTQIQEVAKKTFITPKPEANIKKEILKAKPKKLTYQISEEELNNLDNEFGFETNNKSTINRPVLVNSEEDEIVSSAVAPRNDSEGEGDNGEKNAVKEYSNIPAIEPIRSPILVSDQCIERLPTKEEVLADLEKIDNLDIILNDDQNVLIEDNNGKDFVVSAIVGDQSRIKIIKKQLESKNISDLEKIYFQEDGRDSVLMDKNIFQKPSPRINNDQDEVFEEEPQSKLQWKTQLANHSQSYWPRSLTGFIITGILVALIIPGATLLSRGLAIKSEVVNNGVAAIGNLIAAKHSVEETNWEVAERDFGLAHQNFIQANSEIGKLGKITLGILEHMPGGSLVSSGNHLVGVGENLAEAGQKLSSAVGLFSFDTWLSEINISEEDDKDNKTLAVKNNSLTDILSSGYGNLEDALENIHLANDELNKVDVNSLPVEMQGEVLLLKDKLPVVEELLNGAVSYSKVLLKIMGNDNPRQYLLLFQNNGEARATGGFIGTYGLLKIYQGEIRQLFIDGVFNADGQLREKIIPPKPIQKISTAWSMHDANWFADFPTSAETVSWFYEKTGGPTVDGVLSFTPIVIERLLAITGEIAMPEYDVILTADNFVELIQYKVEIDYDKELNRPKKILADFAPKFIERLNQLPNDKQKEVIKVIIDCLVEKHIMFYFKDSDLEEFTVNEGWGGQVLDADKDYLSVISSNINGFKTDRVIKETINHQAEIQDDGSIIDTVQITRKHEGGDLEYDWWNRVNANYLRVYVPLGSELISAEGHSLESYNSPIDYEENNFKTYPSLSLIEDTQKTDKKTGTQIFTESGKTVFANWAYVSPGETVVLTYKYRLPFKINLTKSADSYSLIAQKQSGSLGSNFKYSLRYPADWNVSWQYPNDLTLSSGIVNYVGDLAKDKFLGVTFSF
ncbi:MAG: DUF4012 domain-containing protein [bacterium]